MKYTVYILASEKSGLKYIGHTADLTNHLKEHNFGHTVSTKNKGPWRLLYSEQCPTRLLAAKRERFLKSGRGRVVLKNLIGT